MVTKKITLNELRSLVKQIVKEGIHDMDILSAPHTNAGVRKDLTPQRDTITNYPYMRKINPIIKKYNLSFEGFVKMAEEYELTNSQLHNLDFIEKLIK